MLAVVEGLSGDAGRPMKDFEGERGLRSGDCGSVREFGDFGERIVIGLSFPRDTGRVPGAAEEEGAAAVLARFLGLFRSASWCC